MGNQDALQLLVNFVSNIFSSTMTAIVTFSCLFAVTGSAGYLMKEAKLARRLNNANINSSGKTIACMFVCGGLAGLHQLISSVASSMGLVADFSEISYVSVGTFGQSAEAVNAVLTFVRLMGMFFFVSGLMSFKRSLKDGHSGLSAGDDVNRGIVKTTCGVIAVCNPYVLDAIQTSLGISF